MYPRTYAGNDYTETVSARLDTVSRRFGLSRDRLEKANIAPVASQLSLFGAVA